MIRRLVQRGDIDESQMILVAGGLVNNGRGHAYRVAIALRLQYRDNAALSSFCNFVASIHGAGGARCAMLSHRRLVTALLAGLLCVAGWGGSSAAAVIDYPNCQILGASLVSHACFHATNGPFVTVPASAVRDFVAPTPNVNAVHTHFTVTLPGPAGANEGTVKYRPARTGDWAIFFNPVVPITVLDPSGTTIPIELAHDVAGCSQLPRVNVVRLTANVTYRLVLGPASVGSVGLVLEKLTDFETAYFRDADGDGYGNPNDVFPTACVPPQGYVSNDLDCDDTRPTPGTPCPPAVPAVGIGGLAVFSVALGLLGIMLARRPRPARQRRNVRNVQ